MKLTLSGTPEQKIYTGVVMAKIFMAAAVMFVLGSMVVRSAGGYPLWMANFIAGVGIVFLILFLLFVYIVRKSRADLNTMATFHSGGNN